MDAVAPQSLCLSCGHCCDGTLFGRVPLEPTDALSPLRAGGIDVQGDGAKHFFDLPCSAHRQGCCQIYADRPGICQAYRCKLLRKYERGAISWAEAQHQVGRLQLLKDTLRTEVARITQADLSGIAVLRIVPSQEDLTADPGLRRRWAPVMLRLSALLDCVQTHFQPPDPKATARRKEEASREL